MIEIRRKRPTRMRRHRSTRRGPSSTARSRWCAIQFAEGRSAQILHVGGPADEHRSVVALYDAVAREGLHPHGHLHEIRLADYERVPDSRARRSCASIER